MNKKLLILGLTLLTFHPPAWADVRVMQADDPNLDANWSWKSGTLHELYSSVAGESPAIAHSALLPFATPGNPLNIIPHDYEADDGWILVHRDFGIPERGQPFPLFSMYNRYRGTFRVMVYNATSRDNSFYIGRLRFLSSRVDQWRPTSLLDFTSKTKCFINNFDLNNELSATSHMAAFDDWAVFDFPLVGYDPTLNDSDPILCFSLSGVDSQHLEANGNASLDLIQQIKSGSVRPGFGVNDIKQAADLGLTYYRTPLNWMEELTNPKNKGQRWYNMAVNLSKTAAFSYAPWIGAFAGVVESFIGGSKKAADWEPLRFNGQMKFDFQGRLVLEKPLWAQNLFLKPGPQSAMAQRPLRDVPWGVFNIQSAPYLMEEKRPLGMVDGYFYQLLSGGEVVVNPDAGLDLISTEVAVKFDRKFYEFGPPPPRPGMPAIDPETDTSYFDSMETLIKVGMMRIYTPAKPVALIYKLTFKTRQPTLNSDDEIVMLKMVDIDTPVEKREMKF